MPYLKINGAVSTVAAYATGSLTVATGTGSRFGTPTADDPILLQTAAAGAIRASAYLVCTSRSGDVLTVSLTSGTVSVDDIVAAGDVAEWWDEIADTYATKTDVADGLAAKQDALTLTTTGTTGAATLTDGVLNIPQYDAADGGGITGLTGDVEASGAGTVEATIVDKAVTYAKLADAAGAGLLGATAAGAHQLLTLGTGLGLSGTTLNAAAGTVTNVGIALPTSLFTNGSAVTSTGNLTATLKTQAANTFLAGPASGADAAPAFRAAVAADIAPLLTGYATTSALTTHTGNTSNPHSVTKDQVGLGSVDNTSDASKPVSTATQTALDGKAATSVTDALDSRIDALEAAPGGLICIGRWLLGVGGDVTAGTADDQADVPVDCVPHSVRVVAATNPSGGGVSFNLAANGSTDLFAAAQDHPDASTASAAYTGFSVSSLAAGDKIGLTVTSAGSGVGRALITLWAREAV